ncbi:MAG: DNA-3-methyladenine glycosylase 2 family protein [Alphaproteobacteria bacterium]|nr:DNA-3-methyladenine glycosylase 2 family protein [Alphaproteobacteria bacterium]
MTGSVSAVGFLALMEQVPAFAAARLVYGDAPLRVWPPGFATLVRIVAGQQLSTKAAGAIFSRLETSLVEVSPATILGAHADSLRALGLSHAKIRALHDLAERIADGRLDLAAMEQADDEPVTAKLTEVKGIGPWTSEIYLLFALNRPDIWPAADLALAVAMQHLLRLDQRPNSAEMHRRAEDFRPWRSYAAHYLWHMYHVLKSQ